MSWPYRMTCHTAAEIPSIAEIRRLATREQHLVLQFPPPKWPRAFDKGRLIETLARELPEYRVFNSGSGTGGVEHVTIKAVISRELVLAHAEALVAAARQFRTTAHALIALLADRLGETAEAFGDAGFRFRLSDDQYQGDLPDGWTYGFHGFECRFENTATQQLLDVKLGFPGEWGTLDPQFFHEFLKTTPEFKGLAALLEDGFHDTARALDVLEEQGSLRRIVGRSGRQAGRTA